MYSSPFLTFGPNPQFPCPHFAECQRQNQKNHKQSHSSHWFRLLYTDELTARVSYYAITPIWHFRSLFIFRTKLSGEAHWRVSIQHHFHPPSDSYILLYSKVVYPSLALTWLGISDISILFSLFYGAFFPFPNNATSFTSTYTHSTQRTLSKWSGCWNEARRRIRRRRRRNVKYVHMGDDDTQK